MIERGDDIRADNRKSIEKLVSVTEKNKKKSRKRSEDLQIDVNKYKAELAKEEEIRISASIDRTIKNDKDLKDLADDITKETLSKSKEYKRNVADLKKFRASINKLEERRIKNAKKGRAANKKLKEKMEADFVKNSKKKEKNYYKDVKLLDKYKKVLIKQELALQEDADKRRNKSDKEIVKAKEQLGVVDKSQENRYKEFKKKLDDDRRRNDDFISDLQTLEKEKILLANAALSSYYMGEKKVSEKPELAKKYAQGITEETEETGNSITIRRTKVTGDHVDIYERVFYTRGGTFFYKNGVNITQSLWDKESIEK